MKGRFSSPTLMEFTSFEPTQFGSWLVKLSYTKEFDPASFVLVAHNLRNSETIIKAFVYETEVIDFVNFLGEKI